MDVELTRATLVRFWEQLDLSSEERERARFSSRRYFPLLDFLAADAPRPSQKILDLGGGIGSVAVAMKVLWGGTCHLADFHVPSPSRQAVLRSFGVDQFFAVRLDEPRALEALPRDYDLIVFAEVLEHLLTNPLVLFREFYDHLVPNGCLLLTTPNQARTSNRLKLALGRSIKEPSRFPTDGSPGYGHVMEYTMDELEQLLRWESFAVERSKVIQNLPSIPTTRTQRALVRVLNTSLAQGLRLGDEMMMLARKVPRPPATSVKPGRV